MGLQLASRGRVVGHEVDGVVMFFFSCSGFLCHIMGLPLYCDTCYEKAKTQAKSITFQNPRGIQVSAKLARMFTLPFLGPKWHFAGWKTCSNSSQLQVFPFLIIRTPLI